MHKDSRIISTTNENIAYANIFENYINRSLDESLTAVRMEETKLSLEERVQACHILDYGLHAPYSWTRSCDLTIALATYMERSGEWDLWQQLLARAIATAQWLGDTDHEITLTALLARLYQRRGEAPAMVRTYRRVIRLARRNGNRYELARACSNLGYHYILTGNLWRAELLSYHALAIFNDLANNHGQAHTHNHLGILFTQKYDWVKAKEHLLAACAIWQVNQDQFGLMRGHGNLGFLYTEIDAYDEGIHHSMNALELAKTFGEEPLIGSFSANISYGHLKSGKIQKAKEFADLAETIFKKYSDRRGLAQISHSKGLIAIHEKNYMKAQEYLDYALNTLTEHYFLIQIKLTKIELNVQFKNYVVAQQELDDLETLITKHLAGNALPFYLDKLSTSRRRLEQAAVSPKSNQTLVNIDKPN